MPRKVELPGADEFFRPTADPEPQTANPQKAKEDTDQAKPTRRVRHDEKITVYISSEELLKIEQARLKLKAEYGIRVDRGRLIREAAAMAIEELDADGDQSDLVKRLQEK